jgi:hypothetical protein
MKRQKNTMSFSAARLLEFSPISAFPFFCSLLLSNHSQTLSSDLVLELTTSVCHGSYTIWDMWHGALLAYHATFDLNFPMVTPLPGGFWDTSNLYIIKNDSDKNDDSKHIMIEVCATDCGCSGCESRLSYPSSNLGNGADQESKLNAFNINMDVVPTLDTFDVNGDEVT